MPAEILPEMIERGFVPDVLTDQTSAHDPKNGYVPTDLTLDKANQLRNENPERYTELSRKSIAKHVEAMHDMQKKDAITFDYGNNIRQVAKDEGVENAFDFPASFPPISDHSFVKEKGRSAGWLYREIRKIFIKQMKSF